MQTQSETKPARRTYTAFSRVVVGIDSSPESLEAARQAAALAEGPISLVAAYALSSGLVGGVAPAVPAYLDDRPLHEIAAESLVQAQKEIPDARRARRSGEAALGRLSCGPSKTSRRRCWPLDPTGPAALSASSSAPPRPR